MSKLYCHVTLSLEDEDRNRKQELEDRDNRKYSHVYIYRCGLAALLTITGKKENE
jgi:hypothetical protein